MVERGLPEPGNDALRTNHRKTAVLDGRGRVGPVACQGQLHQLCRDEWGGNAPTGASDLLQTGTSRRTQAPAPGAAAHHGTAEAGQVVPALSNEGLIAGIQRKKLRQLGFQGYTHGRPIALLLLVRQEINRHSKLHQSLSGTGARLPMSDPRHTSRVPDELTDT